MNESSIGRYLGASLAEYARDVDPHATHFLALAPGQVRASGGGGWVWGRGWCSSTASKYSTGVIHVCPSYPIKQATVVGVALYDPRGGGGGEKQSNNKKRTKIS